MQQEIDNIVLGDTFFLKKLNPGPLTLSRNHHTTRPNGLDVIIQQEITNKVLGNAVF